ncbi:MAG: NAD(P)H-dependent oxidoreductase [Spirochaetaceae bacterium]|nr:NAD(P)H-dependent oxidoreductase [Spirochaetaceae bacterium]
MKITVVYGTERKGCTYTIAQKLISSFSDAQVNELFLPKDLPEFCISCFKCFTEEHASCAHDKYVKPIREKLIWADLIILTSPVYSFHVTGQMKVLLDHFANMWLVHRPEESMFKKQGVVISTASGPVYAKTLNEMKDSLDFWGVTRVYKIGTAVMETDWERVKPKIKNKTYAKILKISAKISKTYLRIQRTGRAFPSFRVLKWFAISRFMQKRLGLNPIDALYWQSKEWTGKTRPWK